MVQLVGPMPEGVTELPRSKVCEVEIGWYLYSVTTC